MKRIELFSIAFLSIISGLCFGLGNKVKPKLDPTTEKLFDYRQITLDNGLEVITLEDFSCPIVAVQVWYEVGSKDEAPDRQGYAHMFEHMMFKGTDRVSEKDHFALLRKVGGNCNAYTSFDQTVYIETLPADQIELALWLEAERMSFLKIDQHTFDTERKVVEEELRMGENKPYGNIFKKMTAGLFAEHPYRWTPIGKMAHLRATSVADLRQFWMDYYVPNNATLVIVGAIEHAKAQALAQQYFGWIPAGSEPKRINIKEPPLKQTKDIVIDDENAPAGRVLLAWRTVPAGQRDETVLDFLSQILGRGHSSRLYRALVADTQTTVEANSWTYNLQQDGFFVVEATLPPTSQDYAGVIQALSEQIKAIQADGITDAEIEKARNQLLKHLVTTNLSIESKARMLGSAAVTVGDIGMVNSQLSEIRSITKADIQRAANHYLDLNRVVNFTIKQNNGMQNARKDDEDAAITAEPELEAPAPGRKGVIRPSAFPAKPPMAQEGASEFELDFEKAELPNGVKVLVVENHEVPFVSLNLGLTHGAWTETKPGTAVMTSAMLTRGTGKYSEAELATAMEQFAITISGSANMDTATVNMNCLKEKLDYGMLLMSNVVLEPAFEQAEFDKLLLQEITRLNIKEQQPDYLAGKYLNETLFGQHPYARTPLGNTTDLKQLTVEDLKQWWKAHSQPDFATLIFAGDISKKEAVDLAKKYFGQWGPAAITAPTVSDTPAAASTTIYLVNRPGSAQAQIQMGQLGITRKQQPDYFVGLLVNAYFGGSFHSRLNENIRIKRGLTYGAWGGYRAMNLAGTFKVSTYTKNESAAETIRVILEQIDELRMVEPSDAEFYDTRSFFVGSFAGQRETPQDIAQDLWLIESQQLGKDYFKKLFETLNETTKQDCTKLAKRTIDPDSLAIVVIGDAEKLKDSLADIAPVKVIEPEAGIQ
ncbi:MAG: pitrilysin family protein [Planctomycetota bacterium]